jgi:uncharacterized membrane-anchored protein YjiN (DUF445 family)
MPTLILQPDLDQRDDIEQWREAVRARRMLAAIEYQSGQNAKLEQLVTTIARRLKQQYVMLGKEIVRSARLDEALSKRLTTIETLKQEMGLAQEMIDIG